MDFARINPARDADEAAVWHVEYDGELLYADGKPIKVSLYGLDGARGKKAQARMAKIISASQGRNKTRVLHNMSVEQILALASKNEKARAEMFADLTESWENILYIEDDMLDDPKAEAEPLAFTRENAVKLYSTRPWIMEGIDTFLGARSNFRKDVGDA